MKSVLISIQPWRCEQIATGQKTLEIRKSRPKLKTPFKCYIYCTLPPKTELFTHGRIREYGNELIRLQNGRIIYGYRMQLCFDSECRPYSRDNLLCQKVIGEFVCDRIWPIAYTMDGFADVVDCVLSCLQPSDFIRYGGGKPLYGWNISDLIIYDKPISLTEFGLSRPPQSWCYVEEDNHG